MTKENKEHRIQVRVTTDQREEIKSIASNKGYDNISKFIIDSTLGNISKDNERKGDMTHIISVSPTIDYFIELDSQENNDVYRFNSSNKQFIPGGRGINISKMMNVFNSKNITIHYSGGFVGSFIFEQLEKLDVNQKWIKSPENSRINLKINNLDGENIIIDQKSDTLSEYGKEGIIQYLLNNVSKDQYVVIAGSFNKDDFPYIKQLSKIINSKKAKLVFNLNVENIEDLILNCQPWFVALNLIDKNKNISRNFVKNKISKLIDSEAKEVAIIVDTNFIYYANKNDVYFVETETNKNQLPIGLADALIAGYISNIDKEKEERYILASASVHSKSINQYGSSYEDILFSKKQINIKKL